MKKFCSLILAATLSLSLLTGCAGAKTSADLSTGSDESLSSSNADSSMSEDTETDGNAIAVAPGDMVLDAPLITANGDIYHLADFTPSDKPLYIVFWEDWCPQCQQEIPILQEVYEDYQDSVSFVTINRSEKETSTISSFLRENGYTFPVYYNIDGVATETYGHPSIPTNIFAYPDGTVSEVYTDTTDMTEDMIRSALDTVLAGS